MRDPSIEVSFYRVGPLSIKTEALLWGAIGRSIQVEITSSDELLLGSFESTSVLSLVTSSRKT
jgi:hypothetical protein